MKTNEIIAGLRKLCGQGTEYRRTVCRLAADTLETQQKRIEELETELKDERHRHDRYVDFELAQAKELEQLRTERRWIPVTERRPTDADTDDERGYGCVEVYSPSSGIDVASVDWVNDFVNDVTHWRPLPEPPKEGV